METREYFVGAAKNNTEAGGSGRASTSYINQAPTSACFFGHDRRGCDFAILHFGVRLARLSAWPPSDANQRAPLSRLRPLNGLGEPRGREARRADGRLEARTLLLGRARRGGSEFCLLVSLALGLWGNRDEGAPSEREGERSIDRSADWRARSNAGASLAWRKPRPMGAADGELERVIEPFSRHLAPPRAERRRDNAGASRGLAGGSPAPTLGDFETKGERASEQTRP